MQYILCAAIFIGIIYFDHIQKQKCKDAGGVYAVNVCVNPSVIIEMD